MKRKINKKSLPMEKINVQILQTQKGITLLVLVITIVLNCCEAAVERMLRKVKELKREKTSDII